jgi:tetratricopeptide (TPR) repeat protein
MAGLSISPVRASAPPLRRWHRIACAIAALMVLPAIGHAEGWFYRDNQTAYKLYSEGQTQQSLAHWDQSSEGSFGRGAALMQLGRMHDAEQAFRLCLQLMPRINAAGVIGGPTVHKGFLASIWYNLGNTLYAQDELKEAAAAWRNALDYQPDHAKARHNLDVVNRLLGKQGEDEDNPAGLTGKTKLGRQGNAQGNAGGKGSPPKQPPQKQESGPQHEGSKQVAKAGEKHRPGTGKDKQQGSQGKGSQAANGHGKNEPGKTTGLQGKDVSVLQTENELRMVQEGVGVFMRHRLGAKHGQLESPYRGPAW